VLAFAISDFSESGLFNELRPIQLKKFGTRCTRIAGCAQKFLPPFFFSAGGIARPWVRSVRTNKSITELVFTQSDFDFLIQFKVPRIGPFRQDPLWR
jgi:hypothetical protein